MGALVWADVRWCRALGGLLVKGVSDQAASTLIEKKLQYQQKPRQMKRKTLLWTMSALQQSVDEKCGP